MGRTRNYREVLLADLREDPELAAEYITASIQEGMDAFLVAIKDVIDARGGGTEFSAETGVPRESIYKMFKEGANPTIKNIVKALDFADLRLNIVPKNHGQTLSE